MAFITVDTENSTDVEIYYEDHGSGRPVVLIHGWPLSGRSWEPQVAALVDAGYRVITYDRRGFGDSGQPWEGYDYDTFAADLKKLLDELDLNDVTLVGFSMGGGELARYVAKYGTDRIAQLVFASAVPPYLWKSEDNPDGAVDEKLANEFAEGITGDRPHFLQGFLKDFFSAGKVPVIDGPKVSSEQIDYHRAIAEFASPKGTLDCTTAFATTDFRTDLTKIDVPTLVIHGDSDQIVPLEASGERTATIVNDAELVVIKGGPHGVNLTHKDEWNQYVITFLERAGK